MSIHEGAQLKKYITEKDISITTLAGSLKMARPSIYLLYGRESLDPELKKNILKALNTSEKEVFSEPLQKNDSLYYNKNAYKSVGLIDKEGALLKQHIDKNKINVSALASQLGIKRAEIFKLFDKEKIPDHYKELFRKANIIIDGYTSDVDVKILRSENIALKRENELLREMVSMLKKK